MADGKWQGIDVDLETSLFEYGFIAKQRADKDYPDEWFVLYRMSSNAYGTGHIREEDLNDRLKEKDFQKPFLNYIGMTRAKWLKGGFIVKLHDLLSYWGPDEIMGTDYHPMDKKGARKMAGLAGGDDADESISRAKDFVETLAFFDGGSPTVGAVPIATPEVDDDKLNAEVTILQGILQGKKLGNNSTFQTASGAMIKALELGIKNDEPGIVELPSTGKQSAASKFISSASQLCATEAKDDESPGKAFKKMIGKNALGLMKQFTGPFYGAIEPFANAVAGKTNKNLYTVSKEEMRIAKKMSDKGYAYAMKVKGDDRLVYFKRLSDAGPYLRSQNAKPEWNGKISDLED